MPVSNAPWHSSVIVFAIVFSILYLFRPFNIGFGMDNSGILVTTLGFAFISAMIEILYSFTLRKLMNANRWTIGKHIISNLLLLVLISVGVFLTGIIIYSWNVNLRIFLVVLNMVLLVGIFPIVILTFFNQNRLLKQHLKDVAEINLLTSRVSANESTTMIGDFQVNSYNLLYIESTGNYVTVWYKDGEIIKHKSVRATMKSIPEQSNLVRCHRAFIVNLDKVIKADGNSQGYRLFIDGLEQQVPVSRAYTSVVRDYFK